MNENIGKMLESPDWSAGEKAVVKWQFGIMKGFSAALFDLISRADKQNLWLLARAFPDEVYAFRDWSEGDLAHRLRDAGLDI